jgi:hypothetical protein
MSDTSVSEYSETRRSQNLQPEIPISRAISQACLISVPASRYSMDNYRRLARRCQFRRRPLMRIADALEIEPYWRLFEPVTENAEAEIKGKPPPHRNRAQHKPGQNRRLGTAVICGASEQATA